MYEIEQVSLQLQGSLVVKHIATTKIPCLVIELDNHIVAINDFFHIPKMRTKKKKKKKFVRKNFLNNNNNKFSLLKLQVGFLTIAL